MLGRRLCMGVIGVERCEGIEEFEGDKGVWKSFGVVWRVLEY